jgi:choline-sulfatase
MTRKQFLCLPAGATAASQSPVFSSQTGGRPKNVLLLMADEHRPHALGIDGDPLAATPNLDALASSSVRFDNAYCTSPVCVPARCSLHTGLYPHHHHVYGNGTPWPFEARTIAHYLSRAGYMTANIGKLHAVDAQTHGFDYFLESQDWYQYLGPKIALWHEDSDKSVTDGRKGKLHVGRAAKLPEEDHYESFVARESIRFLKTYGKRPFFLVSSFVKPHDPFVPAERFAKLYPPERVTLPDTWGKVDLETVPRSIRTLIEKSPLTPELLDPAQARIRIAMYYANLMQMDDRLGAVLQSLRELHLEKDTIVIYTSDHGEMAGDKGLWLKFVMYEGSVGVPLMFRVPGLTAANRRCATVVSTVQMLATITGLCGLPTPSGLDGGSLVPNLREPERTLDTRVFAEIGRGGQGAKHMLRHGDFKYVHNPDMDQLYDLRQDPKEMTNLALSPRYKDKVAGMKAELYRVQGL